MQWGYIIRIGVTATLAGLASLKASVGDGMTGAEWVDLITAFVGAGAAYAGLGAVSKTIEPTVGIKP